MSNTIMRDIGGDVATERLIRMKELRPLIGGLSRQHIYRLMAADRFPKNFHPLGTTKFAVWRYTEVAQWIKDRCDGKVA